MESNWELQEAISYYRTQGAPAAQEALVALLREVQSENGGVLPDAALSEIAAAYGLRETFLSAIVRRYPSLRPQQAPHRLELCGGANCTRQSSAALRSAVEAAYGVKNGGISAAGGFSFRVTGCMKNCGKGPSLKWDGRLFAKATPELLHRLVSGASVQDSSHPQPAFPSVRDGSAEKT